MGPLFTGPIVSWECDICFLAFFSGGGLGESESLYTGYLKALRITLCVAGTVYFGVHDRGKPKPISLPSQLLVDKVNI